MTSPLQSDRDPGHEPPRSLVAKFQTRLAESRYFMLSCVIHAVLVIVAGSLVIYQTVHEPQQFVGGTDGIVGAIPPPDSPVERPDDPVPIKKQEPPRPDISAAPLDRITTVARNRDPIFNPPRPVVSAPTVPKLGPDGVTIPMTKPGMKTGNIPTTFSQRPGLNPRGTRPDNGGKPTSEAAVLRGLNWLQKNQNADGSWGDTNKGAMTGLALLCFLGHGETHESPHYALTVNKAVQWYLDNGTRHEGRLHMEKAFNQHGVYEHAIGTYALAEFFTMTGDERVLELLKQAVGYIVQGQGPGGGWMYSYDKTANDLSVSGWQIQALKAAHLTQLKIDGVDAALDKAMKNVDDHQGGKGGYGYRGPQDRYSLTGVGILAKLFWKGDRGELRKGTTWLLEETEQNKPLKYRGEHADLYAWYYHTQACLMMGGSAWTKWNRWFQDEIVNAQNTDGSWPVPGAKGHGPQAAETKSGAVYRTTLCVLMLEVYYRYMPTTR